MNKILIIIIFSISFLNCSKSTLPEYNRIEKLRVLSLKASTPETSISSSVTITPLISDIKGNGRTLTYSAVACLDNGIGYGEYPDCNGGKSILDLGTGTVTGLTSPNYTGTINTFTFTIPTTVFDNKTIYETYNGVTYVFILTIRSSDGAEIRAIKRIIVSTKSTKNANPSFSNILANDSPMTALTDSAVSLKASYPASSAESYTTYNSDGTLATKQETLVTSWFVSEGSLEFYRTVGTNSNMYSINFRPANPVVILGVLRDDRGGEDTIKLEL